MMNSLKHLLKMKCLSSVVLFSLLSFDFSQGSYPENINIELQIVAYITDENENVYCTAVMISEDRALAVLGCFKKMICQKEHHAHVGIEGNNERKKFKISNNPTVGHFLVLYLDGNTQINRESYQAGLPLTEDIQVDLSQQSIEMTIYGYSTPKTCISNGEWYGMSGKAYISEQPSIMKDYITFRILSNVKDVYDRISHWKSSPIFYERQLFAMCEYEKGLGSFSCYKITKVYANNLEKKMYYTPT